MTTEGDLSPAIPTTPEAPVVPRVGQRVTLGGQPATVIDVAEFPGGACQVVVRLDAPAGRPPVSVPPGDLGPRPTSRIRDRGRTDRLAPPLVTT
jgi:hypothetical protein